MVFGNLSRSVLSGMVILSASACNSTPQSPSGETPGSQPALTTDRTSYLATNAGGEGAYRMYVVTVVARFINPLDHPVYLERCFPNTPHPTYAVLPAAGEAESGYNPVWACVGHDRQIVVLAGATRVDTLVLNGPNSWDGHTNEPFGSLEGLFALSYGGARSNAFQVRLGEQ
jgi:hypothetical protein